MTPIAPLKYDFVCGACGTEYSALYSPDHPQILRCGSCGADWQISHDSETGWSIAMEMDGERCDDKRPDWFPWSDWVRLSHETRREIARREQIFNRMSHE